MSYGFNISVTPQNKTLYVQIQGDFDGSSAQQLIYALKQYVDQFSMIIVDTDRISCTDVFGLDLFRYHLKAIQTTAGQFRFIRFTGKKAPVFQTSILYQHH